MLSRPTELNLWPLFMPFRCLLVCICNVQDFSIEPRFRNNLQADWQTFAGESAWNRDGRQTCQIKWCGETGQPRRLFDCIIACDGWRRYRSRWDDQKVIGFKERIASFLDFGLGAPCESIFC